MDIEKSLKTGFGKLQEKSGLTLVAVFFVIGLVSTIASQSQAAQFMEQFGAFEQLPSQLEGSFVESFAGGGPLAIESLPSPLISLMNLGSTIGYIVAAIVGFRVFASGASDEIPSKTYSDLLMPTINAIIAGIVFGVVVVIGLVLFIIPGIYLIVALYFFTLFIALEGESFIDALRSSWELTKGRRLSVFLFFVALFIVNIVFSIIGGIASLVLGGVSPQLGAIIGVAVGAAFTVFSLGALYDAYTQLREDRRGPTAAA